MTIPFAWLDVTKPAAEILRFVKDWVDEAPEVTRRVLLTTNLLSQILNMMPRPQTNDANALQAILRKLNDVTLPPHLDGFVRGEIRLPRESGNHWPEAEIRTKLIPQLELPQVCMGLPEDFQDIEVWDRGPKDATVLWEPGIVSQSSE